MSNAALNYHSHVVDILGNTLGRDQPVMILDKALELISLLDDKLFEDNDVVFFDPFCKAGEILLACALKRCLKKNSKRKLLSLNAIEKELYESNRYFGLALDERHHKISLRTFLGNTRSHKKKYTQLIRNGNYLSEIDGSLNKPIFEKEFSSMIEYIQKTSGKTRIIAVGNPPYQESDDGFGASAKSIYNFFAESLIKNENISEFVLVIPARWFSGGKGLQEFRDSIRNTKHLENLRYFSKANDVFPTVAISGGICFFHYNKSYIGPTQFTDDSNSEVIDFAEFEIIPDDTLSFPIIRKIHSYWKGDFVGDIAWASKPFGIRTNHFSKNPKTLKKDKNIVAVLSRGRTTQYTHKDKIIKNQDKINLWKVCIPKAYGASKSLPINQIFLVNKGTITTETYNVINTFKNKEEAENLIIYLQTDFARYMLGLRKISQDVPPDRWNWVPYMDTSKVWTDKELFKYFKISKEEQEHIKKKVKEWT